MLDQKTLTNDATPEEMDREYIARGARDPEDKRFFFSDKEGTPARNGIMAALSKIYTDSPYPDKKFDGYGSWDFLKVLGLLETSGKGPLGIYEWMDWYDIWSARIKENASCVAAIVLENDLLQEKKNYFQLKTKNYGACFNLCQHDLFYHQPIASGHICTGFLVKEDVIATAGPWVNKETVTNLRIVFGYQMEDEKEPCTSIPAENLYRGVKVIRNTGNESGWVLVKLDRKVKDRASARISDKEVCDNQSVHVIGHPVGLPLKYVSGPYILEGAEEHRFNANLGLYGSGCGSPVFDLERHDVIGLVEYVDYPGLRWTGTCWVSVINVGATGSEAVRCTCVQVFAPALDSL